MQDIPVLVEHSSKECNLKYSEEARSCVNTNNSRYIFLYSTRPSVIAAGSFAKLIWPKYNGEVEPVKEYY
jgi:hypothetical protein